MANTNTSTTFPVTVHEYPSAQPGRFVHAYEHGVSSTTPATNALVFIGGLGDGPHGVPYVRTIARTIAHEAGLDFSVFEVRLSSSFSGWGYGSLAQDVKEIGRFVGYLRATMGKKKVVLMGHSTGCQDCLEYLDTGKYVAAAPGVDGVILQGPVSDREAMGLGVGAEEVERCAGFARAMVLEGRGEEIVPRGMVEDVLGDTPVSAYRLWSLAAVGGDDDYFSSDLPDDRVTAIWGRLRQPVLIVPSANDEFVPKEVDVDALVRKWMSYCRPPAVVSELSGLIPGANHRVDDATSQGWLAERVVRFLAGLD
ncbi:hypothetical protein B0T22DRAFT_471631 [Podospora appendiculata]|uniref:Uncharacterized protein n=1 Tax=Podospora appendiculata TaxID=314037 RepID=A0AAE0X155_9PEZI|nr:hypothetical protein B0T22DRAFT_471631 [Podospora appendiculata]